MKTKSGHYACLSAAAAVVALLFLGLSASAQDTNKTPAKPAKAASPCKGLDEKACKAKTADCLWIVPTKGKQKPYCRLKSTPRKKS
jgi:hypothetical protein